MEQMDDSSEDSKNNSKTKQMSLDKKEFNMDPKKERKDEKAEVTNKMEQMDDSSEDSKNNSKTKQMSIDKKEFNMDPKKERKDEKAEVTNKMEQMDDSSEDSKNNSKTKQMSIDKKEFNMDPKKERKDEKAEVTNKMEQMDDSSEDSKNNSKTKQMSIDKKEFNMDPQKERKDEKAEVTNKMEQMDDSSEDSINNSKTKQMSIDKKKFNMDPKKERKDEKAEITNKMEQMDDSSEDSKNNSKTKQMSIDKKEFNMDPKKERKDEKAEVTNKMEQMDDSSEDSKNNSKTKQMSTGKDEFNMDPREGIEYLIQHGLLQHDVDDVAQFLYQGEGLNKTAIGNYLGEGSEFNNAVLKAFANLHDFSKMKFLQALRQFLWSFRLPGEAQKIDRMTKCFAERYYELNPDDFTSSDTCYVLSFAIIMLNTSLHNPSVKDKPTVERFISMTRDNNDGKDLPPALLKTLYEGIKKEPFKIHKDDDIVKEGWLIKKGCFVKNWKRRWVVLRNNSLDYFKLYTDNKPIGFIPLENTQVRKCQGKRPHCFELYGSGAYIKAFKNNNDGKVVESKRPEFKMSAATQDEMEEWVKCLKYTLMPKMMVCQPCRISFKRQKSYRRHLRRKHPDVVAPKINVLYRVKKGKEGLISGSLMLKDGDEELYDSNKSDRNDMAADEVVNIGDMLGRKNIVTKSLEIVMQKDGGVEIRFEYE